MEAFGHYEDAPNAALLITNLAAALRRRAYLDFVASGHLTLGQRQIYVQVIALYEQALAQLAAERRQRRRRGRCAASASGGGVTPGGASALAPVARGGLAIRTIVQLELARRGLCSRLTRKGRNGCTPGASLLYRSYIM